ncbi:hypothetical protein [Trinickia dinghuensis]|uniref:DUF4148 domain-containing protein n=1 Tax=Trinickia dinghuensis TaxID=2291023 RepID=A0A3D8JVQ1_9BURK|nr:hypothetical protein [Trinickia dinghuensis]RDU97137.1 hypothetical protein DWV00_21100 [Trinickia dinghuensis]
MQFVHPISLRSRAVLAALGIALAALAAPGLAHADSLSDSEAQAIGAATLFAAEAPVADDAALDDRALARQRGTGPGLMTVGASFQALKGAPSVTLWDEIAPPAPVPVPADSSHVAQTNAVSYFRQ